MLRVWNRLQPIKLMTVAGSRTVYFKTNSIYLFSLHEIQPSAAVYEVGGLKLEGQNIDHDRLLPFSLSLP